MPRYALAASTSVICICLTVAVFSGHAPNANAASRTYVKAAGEIEPFDAVSVFGGSNVIIKIGNVKPEISVFGEPDSAKRLQTKVEGRSLVIREGWQWGSDAKPATVNVTMPSLKSIAHNGSGNIRVVSPSGSTLAVIVNGTGTMSIENLNAKNAQFKLAGTGKVVATGSAAIVQYTVMGTGSTDAHALMSNNATVEMSGTGNISLAARSKAQIKILGSGRVKLTGGAVCVIDDPEGGHVDCR